MRLRNFLATAAMLASGFTFAAGGGEGHDCVMEVVLVVFHASCKVTFVLFCSPKKEPKKAPFAKVRFFPSSLHGRGQPAAPAEALAAVKQARAKAGFSTLLACSALSNNFHPIKPISKMLNIQ